MDTQNIFCRANETLKLPPSSSQFFAVLCFLLTHFYLPRAPLALALTHKPHSLLSDCA